MGGHLFLVLPFMLFGKLLKAADDDASVGAIVDKNGRGSHPGLQVIEAEGNVLSVGSVKHPNFPVSCGLGHSMSIVMKKHSFVSCTSA